MTTETYELKETPKHLSGWSFLSTGIAVFQCLMLSPAINGYTALIESLGSSTSSISIFLITNALSFCGIIVGILGIHRTGKVQSGEAIFVWCALLLNLMCIILFLSLSLLSSN